MSNRGGFGGDGFGGSQVPGSMRQNFRFSEAVAAAPGASHALVGGVTVGQQFVVLRDSWCDGVSVNWATSSGDVLLALWLYDGLGNVLGSSSVIVNATPETYTVYWDDGPVDLASHLGEELVVCAYQPSDEYYSDLNPSFIAVPTIVGPGVISNGNIYVAGEAFPTTLTAVETYGLDANLRAK